MSSKRQQYHSKTITFNGKEIILFSLDGMTWSSRKDELELIQERQENDRVTFEEIRSGTIQKKERVNRAESTAKEIPQKSSSPKKKASNTKKQATSKKAPKKSTPEPKGRPSTRKTKGKKKSKTKAA